MSVAAIGLGFVAGALSILSPCTLPVLPIVLGSAASTHRAGPVALAAGLVAAYVGFGLFLATVGFSLAIDGGIVRVGAAATLGVLALALLVPAAARRFQFATEGVGQAADRVIGRLAPRGLGGQFVVGALLGAMWSPCVGPTLGTASLLAAQGKDLWSVGATMAAFGLGAALPLAAIGAMSREALARRRGGFARTGRYGRTALGATALAASLLIVTGADRALESALVAASPAWLTTLTTRF